MRSAIAARFTLLSMVTPMPSSRSSVARRPERGQPGSESMNESSSVRGSIEPSTPMLTKRIAPPVTPLASRADSIASRMSAVAEREPPAAIGVSTTACSIPVASTSVDRMTRSSMSTATPSSRSPFTA